MNYVLLAFRDERRWETMSASDRIAFEQACRASEEDLRHGLHLIDVKHLQNNTALTVRMVDDQLSLTDGPVGGGQEQLIQLLFILAKDLNAAIHIASKMPQARYGLIEVRPIME